MLGWVGVQCWHWANSNVSKNIAKSLNGFEMDLKWTWNGFEMDLKWIWNGFEMDLKWIWNGFEMDLKWIWNILKLINMDWYGLKWI